MEDDFNPPDICADGRCRDMTGDFVLTVVIPVVLVLILALVSAVLLFRRTKRTEQPEENGVQLARYNSIRRASQNIRELSNHRDSMLSTSRSGSMSQVDRSPWSAQPSRSSTYSAPSTLQWERRLAPSDERVTSPPTYREVVSSQPQREIHSNRSSLQVPLVYYQHIGEDRA
ncbi:uncharacterized protein LOC111133945 [Crassostrea virginica]